MTTYCNNYLRNNKATSNFNDNNTQKRAERPKSFHLLTQGDSIEEKKQVMTKNEIENLRNSVLRLNRPVNPWFETQKPSHKSYANSSPGTSSNNETNIKENSNTKNKINLNFQNKSKIDINAACSKDEKASFINDSLFRAKPVKVSNETAPSKERTIPLGQYSTIRNDDDSRNQIENEEIDYSNFLTPELSLLKQLEKEHSERLELIKNPYKKINFKNYEIDSPAYSNSSENSTLSPRVKKNPIVSPIQNNRLSPITNYNKQMNNNYNKLLGSPKDIPKSTNNKVENKKNEQSRIETYYCFACKELIENVILQAVGESYHPTCFRCSECSCSLDGAPFVADSTDKKKVFCMKDYEKNQIPYCQACKKKITAINNYGQIVRVVFQDKEYHIDCYNCEGCGLQFNNEAENRCYPLNEHLLCRTCHIHWKRFGGMNQPITDL